MSQDPSVSLSVNVSALLATRAILHTTKEAGLEPLQGIKLVT